MLTRRHFCQYVATAATAAATFDLGALLAAARAEETYTVTELGKGRWLLAGGGGNILLIKNGSSPLLVDAGVGAVAGEMAGKVADRIGSGTLTLINTHHHGDHIGGNYAVRQTFGKDIRVVAQQNLVPRVAPTLEESILPGLERMAEQVPELKEVAASLTVEDFAPTETFATELDLETRGTPCQLRHFGPGHTDNDAVVFFPEYNLLHMGDLVFNNLHPYVLPQHGATISGWQNSLRHIIPMCDDKTLVIPGHGETGGRDIIAGMADYFEQVQEIVAAAISEGLSREEVAALKPERFSGRGFERVQHLTLERVFDEMTEGS